MYSKNKTRTFLDETEKSSGTLDLFIAVYLYSLQFS